MLRCKLTIKLTLSSTRVFLLTSRPCIQTFRYDRCTSILAFQDNRSTEAASSGISPILIPVFIQISSIMIAIRPSSLSIHSRITRLTGAAPPACICPNTIRPTSQLAQVSQVRYALPFPHYFRVINTIHIRPVFSGFLLQS